MDVTFWNEKRVLITGHTGFKGGWLTLWLSQMGANLTGIALEPESDVALYKLASIENDIDSHIIDVAKNDQIRELVQKIKPEIVFHLAAQPLVRRSYRDPIETFSSNAMGTVSLLDAVRQTDSVQACVAVTSDKCYENSEWVWGYRESDPMGGHDPYSASKGVSELIVSSMRRSYFKPSAPDGHNAGVASARAGNVIGGGDFSQDRLIPDIIRGCQGDEGRVVLRNPGALRPWQHVLEPLYGYLQLAERLVKNPIEYAQGWNFGPVDDDTKTVKVVAEAIVQALGHGHIEEAQDLKQVHEANLLRLDCSKANKYLDWRPVMRFDETIKVTADWYSAWAKGEDVRAFTLEQIKTYSERLP